MSEYGEVVVLHAALQETPFGKYSESHIKLVHSTSEPLDVAVLQLQVLPATVKVPARNAVPPIPCVGTGVGDGVGAGVDVLMKQRWLLFPLPSDVVTTVAASQVE
jgi:hypothetical protein